MRKHTKVARILALVAILCSSVLLLSSCSVFLSGGVVEVVGEMKTYEVKEEVSRVEICLDGADLEIRTGETFLIESNHRYLEVSERAGTLTVSEQARLLPSYTGFATVIVYVPRGVEVDLMRIEAGAGKVLAEEIRTKQLEMKLGAGSAEIELLNVSEDAVITGGAGMLAIYDGSVANLELETGVGAFGIACKLTGESELNFGLGNANVILIGEAEDYSVTVHRGIGSATLDGEAPEDGATYGQGESKVVFSGGVGTLTAVFSE